MYKQKGSILPALLIFLVATTLAGYLLLGKQGIKDLFNQTRNLSSNQAFQTDQDTKTTDNPSSNAQIIITREGFSPSTITVSKGQLVSWINTDSRSHQIVPFPNNAANNAILPGFDSDLLEATDQFFYTFENTGEYTFQDNIFKFQGVVIVK